jgi:phage replication initiation protein
MARTKVDRLTLSVLDTEKPVFSFLEETFQSIGTLEVEDNGKGMHGFERSSMLTVDGALVGVWACGGKSQRGRGYLDLTGVGCQLVPEWENAATRLESIPGAIIKRVDIAADFYDGQVNYEQTLDAFHLGKFSGNGRAPKMHQILPGTEEEGRTIYVGARGNDKMLRGYEKGKKEFEGGQKIKESLYPNILAMAQGGNVYQDWYRLEVELRSVKRPLPFEVIPMRDAYFTGCYPYLQEVLPEVDAEILVYPKQLAIVQLDKALEGIRRQYGSTLFTALTVEGGDICAVWSKICGTKQNERLVKAGVLLNS